MKSFALAGDVTAGAGSAVGGAEDMIKASKSCAKEVGG